MAIETRYAGHLFRSRLEARWAAFFDLIGWRWTYEPFDADGYIPDFVIDGPYPLLVEIKPATTVADYEHHTSRLNVALADHWRRDVVILGADPLAPRHPDGMFQHVASGLFGEPVDDGSGWWWQPGFWCLTSADVEEPARDASISYGVFPNDGGFMGRPCGTYDGGGGPPKPNPGELRRLWGKAHERTRWTAK